uniref:rhomboid family intramembrane serine protease n=1 Tax=unclassified Thalassolituus TaxID=2624967 RepID=UPI000C0AB8A1|nr:MULTISPECIES: rhomboid family intramembrane serine protease [unclassified Thalassolituus]MAK92612.1 hypothetical protein [Thalassolituus sp.]MAS26302.1 hypothetical protein [Oceanospirillaceae bacterium]MAY01002.1 hypothetical protein [Oceanospirillaceae bacterium]MBL34639.1 hypothetical protein [Oceanospirillaceae bacterium]MBS52491.1 hypothetical protein [Oceanospirillaceae bacterium]
MIILPAERRLDWNNAPVALVAIIVLNILVFFLYQAGDDDRFYDAVESYIHQDFLEQEWPIYQEYLTSQQKTEKLQNLRQEYSEEEYFSVVATLLRDRRFNDYLFENGPNLFYWEEYNRWLEGRSEIREQIASISYLRFGLQPNDLSIPDLLIHQFLHGGFMHLLGNMVFLMICGFVVEAAIGHIAFLAFYLIGGVAAGLTHSLINIQSDTPLVGASGAISAVMAMYLVLYRWKKIQFFYWFYVIVGYFRAPALIILPIYIGKELYSYFSDTESNVAFMAHAGGFVAGAVLIGLTVAVKPSVLNTDYLEESDDEVDPYRETMAQIYSALEKYRFDSASRLIESAIEEYGEHFDLLLLRHNLLKINRGEAWQESVNRMLLEKDLTDGEIKEQEKIWLDAAKQPAFISSRALLHAARNFSRLDKISSAEKIYQVLQDRGEGKAVLIKLADALARACARLNQQEKHKMYLQQAEEMAES